MLFIRRVKVNVSIRTRFSVWLVDVYTFVFTLLSVVIVTPPPLLWRGGKATFSFKCSGNLC